MCSLDQRQSSTTSPSCSSRRTSNKLLSLTPAFPIQIPSDALFKERITANFDVLDTAEELSPENQSKVLFAASDRLSLISTDSTVSSASENEKGNRQPINQDRICLQLSDWLIQSMEERKWREFTAGIDFSGEPIDPAPHFGDEIRQLGDGEGPSSSTGPISSSDFRRQEGNSVFYANSCSQMLERCPQMPSTSRVYDVACGGESESPPISDRQKKPPLPIATRRRRSSDASICQTTSLHHNDDDLHLLMMMRRTNSVQELIYSLTDSSASLQPTFRRAELLHSFKIPKLQILRNWRTPKKKFIFELSKPIDIITQFALQKHRCAGCGRKLDRVYAKRTLHCHYYNKLFCQCCHQGLKARIPARILHEWSFKEYPVCDIAHKFLADNDDQPVFNVRLINPELYRKAKLLRKFRKLRVQISHMWPFVQMCKLAGELMTENGMTMFTSVPRRFFALESVDVYSLCDFERIANRNLIELVEPLALKGAAHIESCERCSQNAFLCQICMDPRELLFPFQLDRCYRCDGCGSLTHLRCYRKKSSSLANGEAAYAEISCEKCERIRRKKFRLQRTASTDCSQCESE